MLWKTHMIHNLENVRNTTGWNKMCPSHNIVYVLFIPEKMAVAAFGSKLMCLLSKLPCLKVNMSSEIVKWNNNTNCTQNWKWWLRIYDNTTEISPFYLRVKALKVFLLHFGNSSIRHLKHLIHKNIRKRTIILDYVALNHRKKDNMSWSM